MGIAKEPFNLGDGHADESDIPGCGFEARKIYY